MSREILFRGKRIDNGEWVEGYLLQISESSLIFNFSEEDGQLFHNLYELESETVCQYTGLVDKNGMKIFEGDILKGNNDGTTETGDVSFEEGAWNVIGDIQEHLYSLGDFYNYTFEVIGNIFDNPELIS